MTPSISVIVTCYNYVNFVGAAIESILGQSCAPDQIIAVDDGSRDGSLSVLSSFGPRVEAIHQKNRGAAGALNTGIARATSDYLAFLDGDDVWPPSSLADRVAVARATGADIVYGVVRQVMKDGETPDARHPTDLPARMLGAMLIRRRCFDVTGGFDESLRTLYSIDWNSRAEQLGFQNAICPDIVLLRRIHGQNLTSNVDQDQDRMIVLRRALKRKREGVLT